MEAIIFCGIQASGKTTYYLRNFLQTHVRISMDLLRTRHREKRFLELCLQTGQRFVADNTNPTAEERSRYIMPALAANFKVTGYFFESTVGEAIRRNAGRTGKARIPEKGVGGTYKRLEVPKISEGFHTLYKVRLSNENLYLIQEITI